MRRAVFFAVLSCCVALTAFHAQGQKTTQQVSLPTSKVLSVPSPGVLGPLNGFAAAIVISPDHRYAAILNNGYGTQRAQAHQSIGIIDLSTNQISDFPEERLPEDAHQSYFVGLAFSGDGKHLYASVGSVTDPLGEKKGDTGNGIAVYSFAQGKVTWERFLKIAPQPIAQRKKIAVGLRKTGETTVLPYPAGLNVISGHGKDPETILVANNYSDNVVLLDPADGRVLKQFDLSTHDMIPSSFPYTVVASPDGRRAWCSLWNASRVAELDLEKGKVTRWIPLLEPKDPIAPGSHPTAMLLSPDGKSLYVALANADRVAVISTDTGEPQLWLDTTIPEQKFAGTFPSALALSSDGKQLFVADASVNAVAVFPAHPTVANSGGSSATPVQPASGFIPTDWYPTALATTGNDLLIATSKGRGTGPNSGVSIIQHERRHREHPYIPTLLYGSIARFTFSDINKQLPDFTRRVQESNLLHSDPAEIHFAGKSNPIHHAIYILKENRTYDQMLGDLKVGDGDPALTMYGADVTPNLHKLALQFGVLDNFYDSGEVSGDGHDWSMAAIASDYNEHTWQIAYRSKERTYDFSGAVADEYPLDQNQPDIDDPTTGFIWDNVASHGLSYRDYGEFIATTWCEATESKMTVHEGKPAPSCEPSAVHKGEPLPANVGHPHGSSSPWPWAVPLLKDLKASKAVLRNHFDPHYPDFNTEYPDQLRADEFLNEFDGFVRARKDGTGTELPAFVLLYLPDDHTHGTTAGKPRPAASVADNDLAVGRVVEAVSHSAYWDDTAIFILEDDAQDGADHVDAHRSTAYVISKYSPGSVEHPFVDHHFYTTVSMIHTLENLLRLPPMNQNDAYAPVIAPLFSGTGSQPAFVADWRNIDSGLIYQTNPAKGQGAKESAKMDFSRPDAANAKVLNAILWRDRKGKTPIPTAQHRVVPDQPKADGD